LWIEGLARVSEFAATQGCTEVRLAVDVS
jgi:hypothetical protein